MILRADAPPVSRPVSPPMNRPPKPTKVYAATSPRADGFIIVVRSGIDSMDPFTKSQHRTSQCILYHRVFDRPSLPSANLTCVGFSWARKALNICVRVLRSRKARNTPRLKPTIEPMARWVLILLVALLRASLSESCRSCLKCSSAKALIS